MSPATGLESSVRYDFDRILERRGTDSTKWGRYECDVLPLWVADMDFPSPEPVTEALRKRVEQGVFGYGFEPAGLRGLVQERLQRLYSWHVEPQELMFLPGVVVGFNLGCRAAGGPGDGVLLQPPVYPPFFRVGPQAQRTIDQAPLMACGGDYRIDFELFEQAITPRTRVFLLCNPHNPVGRVFTRSELEKMAEICLRHDLVICSDEIHQDFVYSGHDHIPIASLSPEVAERSITVFSPSKTFNIAGFHFSIAVVGSPCLRERLCAESAGLMPGRPGVLDFVAGMAAYSGGAPWLEQLLPYLQGNRDFLVRYVNEQLPGVSTFKPEGTYLAWLDCRLAGIGDLPAEFFLKEARVALGEGSEFGAGGKGYVRVNFGCPRSILEEALGRMRQALLNLS